MGNSTASGYAFRLTWSRSCLPKTISHPFLYPNDRTETPILDAAQESPREPSGTRAQGPSEFDELQRRLLGVLQHLRLVDQRLYDFQNVSRDLEPAGVVLHDATEVLDSLYDEIDAWHTRHVHAPKRPLTDEEIRAQTAVIVGGMGEQP